MLNQIARRICTSSGRLKKVTPNNIKGKGTSTAHWLTRQLSDPYVDKAKMMNYRCRSAFKLIEIDDRFRIFSPGQMVIDCGAAPGSWSQVAVKRTNADKSLPDAPVGIVIAVDKQQFYKIDDVIIIGNADFTLPETQARIRDLLGSRKADAVVSDMAPNATGIREMDNENMLSLCYSALRFAVQVSEVDACLIVKMWQSGNTKQLECDMTKFYKSVRVVKPNASRSDSAEIFVLARNFKGLLCS